MGVLYFISRKTLRRLLTAPALQGEGRDRVAAEDSLSHRVRIAWNSAWLSSLRLHIYMLA